MRYAAVALGRRFWTRPEAEAQPEDSAQQPSVRYLQAGDHWLARAVGRADTLLRWQHGVREFSKKRTCLFRIALHQARHSVLLGCGRSIEPGDVIVELHLWNEHLLRIPAGGPNLAWGKLIGRRFNDTLGDLAMHMDEDAALSAAVAICVCGGIVHDGNGARIVRFLQKFGFESFPCPDRGRAGRLVDFFCDVWSFLLVLAYNPHSPRAEFLFQRRCELWMSREVFNRRFGRYAQRTG